jgi:hypothetical protein
MNNELEKFDYDDVLVGLYTACIQYGARKVCSDFNDVFPTMFQEILAQANRIGQSREVPALLKRPDAGTV